MADLELRDLTNADISNMVTIGNQVIIHYSSDSELAEAIAQERPSRAEGYVRGELKENGADSSLVIQYYGSSRCKDADVLPCKAWRDYRVPVVSSPIRNFTRTSSVRKGQNNF